MCSYNAFGTISVCVVSTSNVSKEILGLIIACILLFVCFGVGHNRGKKSVDIQTDTVEIEKVITEYKPVYKGETTLSTQKIKVPLYAIFPEQNNDEKGIIFLNQMLI